jgi:hypothetical protein
MTMPARHARDSLSWREIAFRSSCNLRDCPIVSCEMREQGVARKYRQAEFVRIGNAPKARRIGLSRVAASRVGRDAPSWHAHCSRKRGPVSKERA